MVCFIRTSENRLFCIYSGKKTINCREYYDGEWTKPTALAALAGENFHAEAYADKTAGLVFAAKDGGIGMLKFDGKVWRALPPGALDGFDANSMISLAGGSLIYSADDGEGQSLYMRCKAQDAVRLDKTARLAGTVYQLQKTSPDHEHYLLFYSQRKNETQLGYREIVPGRAGDFISVYGSSFPVSDISFLTTYDSVFAAIAVKGMFSQQILFKEKSGGDFSKHVVVWEGQRLERVLLSMINNELLVHFISNGLPYYCVSQDKGKSFSRPVPCKDRLPVNIEKAAYVSALSMKDKCFIRELFVDSDMPWQAQIIPGLLDGFYPETSIREAAYEAEPHTPKADELELKTHYEADQEFFSRGLSAFGIQAHRENEYNSEYINRLKNKISDLEQENLVLKQEIKVLSAIRKAGAFEYAHAPENETEDI